MEGVNVFAQNSNVMRIAAALAIGARVTYSGVRSSEGVMSGRGGDKPFSGEIGGFNFLGRTLGLDAKGESEAVGFNGWVSGHRFRGSVTSDLRFTCTINMVTIKGAIESLQFIDSSFGVSFSGHLNGQLFSGCFNDMAFADMASHPQQRLQYLGARAGNSDKFLNAA